MGLKRQHGLALPASTRLRSSHPCILCAPNILASCTFCETKLSFSKETKATLAPPRRGADKQGPRPAVDKQRGPPHRVAHKEGAAPAVVQASKGAGSPTLRTKQKLGYTTPALKTNIGVPDPRAENKGWGPRPRRKQKLGSPTPALETNKIWGLAPHCQKMGSASPHFVKVKRWGLALTCQRKK
jgi:hypothetical protein